MNISNGFAVLQMHRVEFPVPEPALREAVLNALTNRDYSAGTPTQISVYPEKILIWNPGTLPQNWTVENLLTKHSSQPFNPDIANVFFRAGKIEAWGRGIARIFESCQKENAPKPLIDIETTGFWIHFPLPVQNNYDRMTGKSSVKSSVKIVNLLKTKPEKIIPEIAEELHSNII